MVAGTRNSDVASALTTDNHAIVICSKSLELIDEHCDPKS